MKKLVTILAAVSFISTAIPVYAQIEHPKTEIIDGVVQMPLYPVDGVEQDSINTRSESPVPTWDDIVEGVSYPGNFDYERFLTIEQQWQESGYPDDIGGSYVDYDAEKMGVFVVNPTPERIEELLLLLGDETIITSCAYSHNELMRVHEEISGLATTPDSKIYTVGLGWINMDGVFHGFGESGKESRVVVGVDESEYDRYTALFAEQYGDMVVVETTVGGIVPYNDAYIGSLAETAGGKNRYWALPIILIVGLLGTFVIIQRQRTQRMSAMQTTIGDVVTVSAAATRKETIAAIKNSAVTPSDKAYNTIMERVDRTQK